MEPKEMPLQLRILLRQKASLDHVDKSGVRLPTVADDSDPGKIARKRQELVSNKHWEKM